MFKGPIILVDDDPEDQLIFSEVINDLQINNELIVFSSAEQAYTYLTADAQNPFFILCDVNMPFVNGFELKAMIENNRELNEKHIPFIFLSTNASKDAVAEASKLGAQGYFQKPASIGEITTLLRTLISYWSMSRRTS